MILQVFCSKMGKKRDVGNYQKNHVEMEARSISRDLKGAELCTEMEKAAGEWGKEILARRWMNKGDGHKESKCILI